DAEVVGEPVGDLARAGRLSRPVAAQQRDDRPSVREMLATLPDGLEPAAQREEPVHHPAERQRQRRPSRMWQQTTVQLAPYRQPAPAGVAGTQRRKALVDELRVEGRKVRREDVRHSGAVRSGEQGVELDLDPFQPARLPPQHRVEGVVALHHPRRERDKLELGCGDREHRPRYGRGQQRLLDGETVDGAPNAADHEPVMRVHVDQPARDRVETEVALDAGDRAGGRRVGAAESQRPQYGREACLGGAVDQEIDIPLAAHPARALPVSLPLEVDDALVHQRFAQPLHQRRGGGRTSVLGGPGEGRLSRGGAQRYSRVSSESVHISFSAAGGVRAASMIVYGLMTISYTTGIGRAKAGCSSCATSLGNPPYAALLGAALNDTYRFPNPRLPRRPLE